MCSSHSSAAAILDAALTTYASSHLIGSFKLSTACLPTRDQVSFPTLAYLVHSIRLTFLHGIVYPYHTKCM